MARHLADVHAADLSLSAISERRPLDSDDPALQALAGWAAEIDAHPMAIAVDPHAPVAPRRTSRHAARSVVAIAAALALSSGGIAAAVKGDPFAPINYMVDKFGAFGVRDRTPDDGLFGSRRSPHDLLALRRARALQADRPSRDGDSVRQAQPTSGGDGEPPIAATRERASSGSVSASGSGDGSAPTKSDHKRLAVPTSGGTGSVVERPKRGGGQTPPTRPEPAPLPTESPWPKPSPDTPPAPPDEPLPSPGYDALATG
jgi:hypothetical protein